MPKTFNHLLESICSLENLLLAARQAGRGKRRKEYADRFLLNLEREIWPLREELLNGTYRPGGYRTFWISDPKRRMISAAPLRDRVVHHAICNVIEPLWERRFVSESFANRRGKGSSAARDHFWSGIRKYRFVFRLDFMKFFPSMDHEILKRRFRRVVRCRPTLELVDRVVDGSNAQVPVPWYFDGDDLWTPYLRRRGLPLGNQTSQFFANVYLDPLDHFIKEELRCPHYVRYVDDLALFSDSSGRLREWRDAIAEETSKIRLKLHPKKCRTFRSAEGVTFLGMRFWPAGRRLASDNVRRVYRRLRKQVADYRREEISQDDFRRSWQGWYGHAVQAGAYGLVSALREEARQWRAGGESSVPRGARRRLEQSSCEYALRPAQQEPTR